MMTERLWHEDDKLADAKELAKKLVGNHREFESFGWSARPEDDQNWTIVYTKHRDSDALDRSNARAFARVLDPFCTGEDNADCRAESHGHWAVGSIDGYAIRVYNDDGSPTPAFLAYAELHLAKEEYPILDEDDFSQEEQEEAEQVWKSCYSPAERIAYMRRNWSQFEHCQARWNDPKDAWRNLLACVRGEVFYGYASELLT